MLLFIVYDAESLIQRMCGKLARTDVYTCSAIVGLAVF